MVEDQADTINVQEERETEVGVTSTASTNRSTTSNYHAWVTIIETSSHGDSRPSSAVCSDLETASIGSGSVSSAKPDKDSISISSNYEDIDATLEFSPQTSTRKELAKCTTSAVQHTTVDIRSVGVNSETVLGGDRDIHSNDFVDRHDYEVIDAEPIIRSDPMASTHTSQNLMPPVKLKVDMEKEQESLITKFPTPDMNIKHIEKQHTLLNTATHTRYDYENHTLNFQHHNQGPDDASLPPRSLIAVHPHRRPFSPTPVSTSPRQETVFERTDFRRLDTPRTLLAKKLEKVHGLLVSTPTTQQPKAEELNTSTRRQYYENHTLPFEHQKEGTDLTALPPRSLTATHTHARPTSPMANTAAASRLETVPEWIDSRQLETPRTLLTMQSGSAETTQECGATNIPAPDINSEQAKTEECVLLNTATDRHNYENHTLTTFERKNKGADHIPLPPRSTTATHTHGTSRSISPIVNDIPKLETVVERTDFKRLATPSTLKKLGSQSGKPTSATPDYIDEDYINTALLSVSSLPSPTSKSGSTIAATPDYVDEDYINTALIAHCDHSPHPSQAGVSSLAKTDSVKSEYMYVNTTPPTSLRKGVRPLPLVNMGDDDDELVYDYPDLRNSPLLLSPLSHKIHKRLHMTKSDPLRNISTVPLPHRSTKARAASDASNTSHLTTTTKAMTSNSEKSSDKTTVENADSTNSLSRQDTNSSLQDYVNGYVNTELQHPLPSRERSTSNEEENPLGSDEEFEYDYLNIERTIRFNFGASQQNQKKLASLPPRKGNATRTTFSSNSSPDTSSKKGSSTPKMNTPLPQWWLQLIEERERRQNNPDLYIHFASGRRKSYQHVTVLPPRRGLNPTEVQHHQNASPEPELLGIDTDEYMVMASAGCTVDDNYVNWETIYSTREYLSPHIGHATTSKALPPRGVVAKSPDGTHRKRYSVDDMEVAYIVRPPRDPVALPPRGVPRTVNPDESKSENDHSEKRSSVVMSQQMKPQVKPKPASLVANQRKEGVSHTNLKASELKPKVKPKPKIKPKPKTDPSTKPPLKRTASPLGGEKGTQSRLIAESADQLQHPDNLLSPDNRLTHPLVPRRPPRLNDHSAPSESTLKEAK